jgi:hypothetical protein
MWYWPEDEILRWEHVKLNMEHLELHKYVGDFYAFCQYFALLNKKLRKQKF